MSWHALCRYLDVIIDLSRAAQMADFRPSRLALMARAPCPCGSQKILTILVVNAFSALPLPAPISSVHLSKLAPSARDFVRTVTLALA